MPVQDTTSLLTVNSYEHAVMDSRFAKLLDLVELFRSFDFAQLGELLSLVQQIRAATDLKTRVKLVLQLLAMVAAMTPTGTDDRILEGVRAVLTDELLDVLTRIVGGMLDGQMAMQDVSFAAADRTQVTAAGLDWSFLVRLALDIVHILGRLTDAG